MKTEPFSSLRNFLRESYYFREINAPDGYLRGEDLKFEITEGRGLGRTHDCKI